jgi:hypothetical protein
MAGDTCNEEPDSKGTSRVPTRCTGSQLHRANQSIAIAPIARAHRVVRPAPSSTWIGSVPSKPRVVSRSMSSRAVGMVKRGPGAVIAPTPSKIVGSGTIVGKARRTSSTEYVGARGPADQCEGEEEQNACIARGAGVARAARWTSVMRSASPRDWRRGGAVGVLRAEEASVQNSRSRAALISLIEIEA